MDQAQALLNGLWEPFSILSLTGYACLGVLLGGLLGVFLVMQLQRRGWLARRKRWHHWLLKLHFLLLPLGGAFLGAEGGLLYGGQQQVSRHLDAYAPLVQEVANGVWGEFETFLDAQDQQELGRQLQQMSTQEVLEQLAAQHVQGLFLAYAPQLSEATLRERIALKLLNRLRTSLLNEVIGERVVEEASVRTGMDPKIFKQVLDARIEQLFQADFLLGLLKQQVSKTLKPFYMAVLLQFVLLLVLIGLEVLLSRHLRQLPGGIPAEPAVAT